MISLKLVSQLVGVCDSGQLGTGGAVHVADADFHGAHANLAQHRHIDIGRLRSSTQRDLVQPILSLNLAEIEDESGRFVGFLCERLLGQYDDVVGEARAGLREHFVGFEQAQRPAHQVADGELDAVRLRRDELLALDGDAYGSGLWR